jgi:hypothetical protein
LENSLKIFREIWRQEADISVLEIISFAQMSLRTNQAMDNEANPALRSELEILGRKEKCLSEIILIYSGKAVYKSENS